MEALSSFASIPVIVALCYFVAEVYRWIAADDEGEIRSVKVKAFAPILCGFVGMIIGVWAYYYLPEIIHSDNVLAAAATGITSGLASVCLQTMKQEKKDKKAE